MSIVLSNFCKIKKADVKIDGLTVIAGPNDTGKSTIGKALYAIIKAQINFPEFYTKIRNKKIIAKLSNPFFAFIGNLNFSNEDSATQQLLNEISNLRFNFFMSERGVSLTDEDVFINNVYDLVNRCKQHYNVDEKLYKIIQQIYEEYQQETSDEEKFKTIAEYYFHDTFSNNLNNSVSKEESQILFTFKGTVISKISIKDNSITQAKIDKAKNFLSFTDVTFIDSPLYLEKSHKSDTSYTQDLKHKINIAQEELEKNQETKITKKIISILSNAKFCYNNTTKDIEYKINKNADNLKIINIASGSKSFGILYLLLKTNLIKNDTIIVLDEPENHLHPEWQIKYAEILTLLVKENYHIVLTSHSPTFIHALATYAKEYKIDNKKINFYLAKKIKKKNYSILKNVNNDIEKIYENLYAPNDLLYSFYHD